MSYLYFYDICLKNNRGDQYKNNNLPNVLQNFLSLVVSLFLNMTKPASNDLYLKYNKYVS